MVMKISLMSDKQSAFKFTASCKDLDAVLTRLNSVVSNSAASTRSFIAISLREKIAILAFNTDTYAYMIVPNTVSVGDGAFGFAPDVMQGMIKGRSMMAFTFTGSECEFKLVKGKYSGKFVVLPITADQATTVNSAFSSKEKVSDTTLEASILDALKEGVTLTSIKDVYSGESLLSYINLTSKGVLTVSCFDQHHFGYYSVRAEQKGVTFKIAMPSSHFQVIDRMTEGEDAKFYIKSESIRVDGADFSLILPSTQTEAKNFNIVNDYMSSLEAPDLDCSISMGAFATLTDNLFTLHSANTSFDLSYKKGDSTLGVTFNTSNGQASDSLKIADQKSRGSLNVKVEPRVLKDVLSIIGAQGDAALGVKKDRWVTFEVSPKSGAVTKFVCSLVG